MTLSLETQDQLRTRSLTKRRRIDRSTSSTHEWKKYLQRRTAQDQVVQDYLLEKISHERICTGQQKLSPVLLWLFFIDYITFPITFRLGLVVITCKFQPTKSVGLNRIFNQLTTVRKIIQYLADLVSSGLLKMSFLPKIYFQVENQCGKE